MAKVSPFVLAPPLLFGALAVLFYLGTQRDNPDGLPSVLVGEEPPALTLTALPPVDGFDLAALGGEGVKLVNFWASWCAPCRAEHPNLEALAEEGYPIFGVNYKDDPEKALAFLDELGNPFAGVAADRQGRTAIDWGVYGVPETFVIDAQGKVVFRFAGPITQRALAERIRPVLNTAKGP